MLCIYLKFFVCHLKPFLRSIVADGGLSWFVISRQTEARAQQQNKSQLLDDRDDKQWIMQDFAVSHNALNDQKSENSVEEENDLFWGNGMVLWTLCVLRTW